MNTQYIQANHIIQRYLHGKLTVTETIEFEEYLLNHPEMVEEFELSAAFRETLSPALVKAQSVSRANRILRYFWPVTGALLGSAATWLMLGIQQPKHVPASVSPEIIYIGEMRGSSTSDTPPVGAVLEQNSQQQILVLDVSMAEGLLFDVTVESAGGDTLQSWPALKKNSQGELVILASLQQSNTPSAIISVRQAGQTDVLLSSSIITDLQ